MYNSETTLSEMLSDRTAEELVSLLQQYSLPFPWEISAEDQEILLQAFAGEKYPQEYILRSLDPDAFVPIEKEDGEDEEHFQARRERQVRERKQLVHAAHLIQEARRHREDMAAVISEYLKRPDVLTEHFALIGDEEAEVIRKAGDPGGIFIPLDLTRNDSWDWKGLEKAGYVTLRRLFPEESGDKREHLTGVFISAEVRDLYRSICTEENMAAIRTQELVENCCYVLVQYHDLTLAENAFWLYKKALKETKGARELTYREFLSLVQKAAEEDADTNVRLLHVGRKYYVTADYILYPVEAGDFTLEEFVEEDYDEGAEYFIPSPSEMKEFRREGWWPSKKPYADLYQFLREFYMDEQSTENMGRAMMNSVSGDDFKIYSDDMVDKNAEGKIWDIAGYFMNGTGAEEIYAWMEDITAPITEKSRNRFMTLLKECEKVTPQQRLHGFSPEQMENKKRQEKQ